MKTIVVSLAFLVVAVLARRKGCNTNKYNIIVCKNSGIITRVIHPENRNNIMLDLDSNTTIGPNAFTNVNNWQLRLTFPDKGSPHTLSLQPGSFLGIEYITNLDIKNANITYSGNPWSELGGLTIFKCLSCGFTEVPTEMLRSFPHLEELGLQNNPITAVLPNALKPLKNLKLLNLSTDESIILHPGCFTGLEELEELEIPSNAVTLVPGVFDGLKKLETLKLYGNFTEGVTLSDVLRVVPTITDLEWKHGNVDSFPTGMFDDYLQLQRLSFINDNIRHIPNNVFNKLGSLVELSFLNNHIATVEPGAFLGLNLSSLSLGFNSKLSVLETGTFQGLNVDVLQLSHGDIREVRPKAFDGLKVNVVSLSDNKLMEIGADDFFGLDTAILDLRQNNLTNIASGAFKNTKVQSMWLDRHVVDIANKSKWGLDESVDITGN